MSIAKQIAELQAAVSTMLEWSSYQTEYDGRMYIICHSCGGQDGEHNYDCDLPKFRKLIE